MIIVINTDMAVRKFSTFNLDHENMKQSFCQCMSKHPGDKRSTLVLKFWEDVTRSPKQGCQ